MEMKIVGLFFGSKMGGADPKSWEKPHRDAEFNPTNPGATKYLRKASFIGIYQGEIELHAKIGEKTSSLVKTKLMELEIYMKIFQMEKI